MDARTDAVRRMAPFTLLEPAGDAFRLVVDTIRGLVWSAQPDGFVDFLNRRWCDYTGLSMSEASGWDWHVAIHPADLPARSSAGRTSSRRATQQTITAWIRQACAQLRAALSSSRASDGRGRTRAYDG